MANTPIYGWTLPAIGGDNDAWGGELNANLSNLDTQLGSTTITPVMNGTATVGTSLQVARADHVHPTDTSCAPATGGTYVAKAGDTMTGNLTISPTTGTAPQLTVNNGSVAAPANIYMISTGAYNSNFVMGKGQSGQQNLISSYTGSATAANLRWQLVLGNATAESGSNAGSDFQFNTFTDTGAALGTPLVITRSNAQATFSASVFAAQFRATAGYFCQPGINVANRANKFNIDYTGTLPQLWIDSTNLGTFSFTSDYRIKRDVEPLPSMWEKAKALKPIRYKHKDYTPPNAEPKEDGSAPDPLIVGDDVERWGFVAHELQETLIEHAASGKKDQADCIQSPNPWTVIATLTKALQEAMVRIEKLEAARG